MPLVINELSQEELAEMTPDKIREIAAKEEAEQSDDSSDDNEEEHESTEDDDQSEDDHEDSEDQEEDDNDSEDDANSDEDDDSDESDESEDDKATIEVNAGTVDTEATKSPKKKDKTKANDTAEEPVDYKAFHAALTAPIKAAGQEYIFKSPDELIALAQKGIAFTQKMQSISHLKGINDILTKNGLSDPDELAFLIDVKNGKPEAIAKLIKDHNIDTYDLDEDKAASYQQSTVDVAEHTKIAMFQEVVETNSNDENFSTVLNTVKTWDNDSQQYLLDNPNILEKLRDQKVAGHFDKIMQEVARQNIVNPSTMPIMQQYVQVGNMLLGNGGSAQNTQQPKQKPAERVIVKRGNVEEQRKRVAPTKSGNGKSRSGSGPKLPRTIEELNNLSFEELEKIDLNELRKVK